MITTVILITVHIISCFIAYSYTKSKVKRIFKSKKEEWTDKDERMCLSLSFWGIFTIILVYLLDED